MTSHRKNSKSRSHSSSIEEEPIHEEKSHWRQDQDEGLKSLITKYGEQWSLVASEINKTVSDTQKTGKQCRERWRYHINPAVSKHAWTAHEDLHLIVCHKKVKNSWAEICVGLKGRNNNMIKNRFYTIFRKVRNKILKDNYEYSGKLELLEILYIIDVMEYYIENPLPPTAHKLKRGKDFAYTLIKKITLATIQKYKKKIQTLSPSLDSLIEELEKQDFSEQPQENILENKTHPLPISQDNISNKKLLKRKKIEIEETPTEKITEEVKAHPNLPALPILPNTISCPIQMHPQTENFSMFRQFPPYNLNQQFFIPYSNARLQFPLPNFSDQPPPTDTPQYPQPVSLSPPFVFTPQGISSGIQCISSAAFSHAAGGFSHVAGGFSEISAGAGIRPVNNIRNFAFSPMPPQNNMVGSFVFPQNSRGNGENSWRPSNIPAIRGLNGDGTGNDIHESDFRLFSGSPPPISGRELPSPAFWHSPK